MNTPNNKRRQDSRRRMETALVRLLQDRELGKITVKEICAAAEVNRTTFYANYLDIYDLADAVQKSMEETVLGLYSEEQERQTRRHDFTKLVYHIKENPIFYKTYFKLNVGDQLRFGAYDIKDAAAYYDRHVDYHIEFFRHGFNAVIKMWLSRDCAESPEEIIDIIKSEYGAKLTAERLASSAPEQN